jgi:hypothetical protein
LNLAEMKVSWEVRESVEREYEPPCNRRAAGTNLCKSLPSSLRRRSEVDVKRRRERGEEGGKRKTMVRRGRLRS